MRLGLFVGFYKPNGLILEHHDKPPVLCCRGAHAEVNIDRLFTPNFPTNITPTNIASGKFPMGLESSPLQN